MCGIVVSLWESNKSPPTYIEELEAFNRQRGPDSQGAVELDVPGVDGAIFRLRIYASVLHLRGDRTVAQPHGPEKAVDDLFCWNGEVFAGLAVLPSENDGALLYQSIKRVGVEKTFQMIEGPYAFIHYQPSTATLYYGRDALGRRSLLIQLPTTRRPSLVISSTSSGVNSCEGVEEVSPGVVHSLRLSSLNELRSDLREACVRSYHSPIQSLNQELPTTPTEDGQNWDNPSSLFDKVIVSCLDELTEAVRQRVQDIPHPRQGARSDADVAILFSGGLDCSVIACLTDRHLDPDVPIDLLNVAFENPRILGTKSNEIVASSKKYDVPDRISAREELQELRRLSPKREWRLIEIDVPYEECMVKCPRVEALMYPSNTVMDRSLALALWFASRGIGLLSGDQEIPYTSQAKVLLSGLGADELFGGYSRHRKAFSNHGWQGLIDELQLDLTRLPSRNMGRDDRVISDNGKECRYPFLALEVVRTVAQIQVHLKVNPNLEEGTGDKQLLRMIAHRLGLTVASHRRKRALQFGSRSARMEGGPQERHGNTRLS